MLGTREGATQNENNNYYVLRSLYLPVLRLLETQVWNLLMGIAFCSFGLDWTCPLIEDYANHMDPIQKWLLVLTKISLNSLAWHKVIFSILCLRTRLVRLIWIWTKEYELLWPLLRGAYSFSKDITSSLNTRCVSLQKLTPFEEDHSIDPKDAAMDSSRRKSRRSRRRLEEEFGKTDRESIERRKRSLRYSSGYLSGVTVEQEGQKADKPHASLWLDCKTIVRIYSVVKDAWTVKGKVWSEAENEECELGRVSWLWPDGASRFDKPILRKNPTVLQSSLWWTRLTYNSSLFFTIKEKETFGAKDVWTRLGLYSTLLQVSTSC